MFVLKQLIGSDASAALGIAYRRGLAGKTRHVQVQYLWIQQEVANKHVKIQKVLGTDNSADALTKFFLEAELERHVAQMDYVYKNADLRVENRPWSSSTSRRWTGDSSISTSIPRWQLLNVNFWRNLSINCILTSDRRGSRQSEGGVLECPMPQHGAS